ncbi:hypothetical protein C8F01DRAFT_1105742 [Mycena amicta]|nr:hypothetical protein C8F01DRAFT_1105742 [Mycena amicta]
MRFQLKNIVTFAALMSIGVLGLSVSAERSTNLTLAPEIVPVPANGPIGAVQDPNTFDTRLYFQAPDGSITELAVDGPFSSPHTNNAPGFALVPANEVLPGTAIAAILINGDIHVYFFSPAKVLSEYIWQGGWNGGPSCTFCITTSGFAASNTATLYAMVNSAAQIRVGFVSAGVPGTIVEAGMKPGGTWSLNSL